MNVAPVFLGAAVGGPLLSLLLAQATHAWPVFVCVPAAFYLLGRHWGNWLLGLGMAVTATVATIVTTVFLLAAAGSPT